jgi:hypothetical protein
VPNGGLMVRKVIGLGVAGALLFGAALVMAGATGEISDPRGDQDGPSSRDLRSGAAVYDTAEGLRHTVTVRGTASAKSPPVLYFNELETTGEPEYALARGVGGDALWYLPNWPNEASEAQITKTGEHRWTYVFGLCLSDYEWSIAYQDGSRVLDRAPNTGYAEFSVPTPSAKRC